MNDLKKNNLDYFAKQHCSVQWRAFLTAFAGELGQQIPVGELRTLMGRLGRSMARSGAMPQGNTMAELEASINQILFDMSWGWVALVEKNDGLYIEHHAAPLQQAFGDEALPWSSAILEGMYAHWFSVISGDPSLKLVQVGFEKPENLLLVFRFGR